MWLCFFKAVFKGSIMPNMPNGYFGMCYDKMPSMPRRVLSLEANAIIFLVVILIPKNI